ncbi:MAG: hypothetical protein WCT53_04555 [Candidatus Gracilibacteria bacterium]
MGLPDPEIVEKLTSDDRFAAYIRSLQFEVYQDDTLANVRQALMEEATNWASVDCEWLKDWGDDDRKKHRESTYSLAFDPRKVVDLRARVLAKVRCAIKREYPETAGLEFRTEKKEGLQRIMRQTQDGDLAYRYNGSDRDGGTYLAGEDTTTTMFDLDLKFSPELQLKMVAESSRSPFDQDTLIVSILAQEGKLSIDAWKVLLKRDDTETYRAIWNTKDTHPEVIAAIMETEKFALLFKARTNEEARREIIRRAAEFNDVNIANWILNREEREPA